MNAYNDIAGLEVTRLASDTLWTDNISIESSAIPSGNISMLDFWISSKLFSDGV